ncbi:MAG: BspA family leucine-rich repeat surface protein [Bacteroidaceae bacterium]|nr:BspA family leucine-rich repeat surface protein [Bacteroidaceae bacterium]
MRYLTVLVTLLLAVQGVRADNVAQAIWCSGNKTLYFAYESQVSPNSTYDGQTVTKVYSVSLDTYTGLPAWNESTEDVDTKATKVVFRDNFKTVTPKSCQQWFQNFWELTEIVGLEYLNTSEVENMDFMFDGCEKLEKLDVSNFDVTKVASALSMFKNCSSLKTIYCNKVWTISNNASMFYNCTSLKGGIAYVESKADGDLATPKGGYFTARLTINAENLNQYVDYYGDITLNCSLYKDGHWNTLCLPFDVTNFSNTVLKDATVKYFYRTDFDDKDNTLTLNFTEMELPIEACTPFIVKWADSGSKDAVTSHQFYGVTIKTDGSKAIVKTDIIHFKSCFEATPFPLGKEDNTMLYLGSDDNLYYPGADGVTIAAFHAYFQLQKGYSIATSGSAKIRNFVMNFDGEDDGTATGIASLPEDTKDAATWYTLDGRRLSGQPTQKGIYINNGKKFMIK